MSKIGDVAGMTEVVCLELNLKELKTERKRRWDGLSNGNRDDCDDRYNKETDGLKGEHDNVIRCPKSDG